MHHDDVASIPPAEDTAPRMQHSLSDCVEQALETYFTHLEGTETEGLYDLLLREVERPLLIKALRHCRGNQTHAARLLGLSRATLRKKMRQHLDFSES